MLELKRLSVDDGLDIYTMLQEIPAEENGLINKANGLTFDEYKEWLIVKQRDSEQEGIVDGWKVRAKSLEGHSEHCRKLWMPMSSCHSYIPSWRM